MNMQTSPNQVPQQRFYHSPRFQNNYQKTSNFYVVSQFRQHQQQIQNIEFDGKRLRKAVARKTVDYNSSVIKYLENRLWQRDHRDRRAVQTDVGYYTELAPPLSMVDNPINAVTTKFVRTSTNKMRCPIFCVAWTPEGRRLVTGASSGEFTLWNGLTFNFETILQAHDSPVRCMVWSHNDLWMVTGDHSGYVKYWQSNMNNVKMFQAHKEPLRGISFCPTDAKFATCSDDGTVRIWDFMRCAEERILRGHGADVKCLDWHPQKGLIVSGSKDSQQPIKLWDPKMGQSLATIHAHKSTVMEVKWNSNGNWLLTASRDHLLKLFDIRKMNQEVQTFRGHKKEACSLAWHPVHETLFASGGSDGSLMFWVVGADKEVGGMEQAHDSCVWSLAWHPLGHILCSGSNDHTSKFWTRNRPGDRMGDKYNLNTLPRGQDETAEYDEPSSAALIPGMGLEHGLPEHLRPPPEPEPDDEALAIPGLDFGNEDSYLEKPQVQRKIPFSKPIPIQFQQQWMENKQPLLLAPPPTDEKQENDALQGQPLPQGQQPPMPGRPPPFSSIPQSNFPAGGSGSVLEGGGPPTDIGIQDIDRRDLPMPQPGSQMSQDFDDHQMSKYVGGSSNSEEWRQFGREFGDQDLRLHQDSDLRPKDMDHRNFGGNGMMSHGRDGRWSKMNDLDDRTFFGQGREREEFGAQNESGNFGNDFDKRNMHSSFQPALGPSQGPTRGRGRNMMGGPMSRMPYHQGGAEGGGDSGPYNMQGGDSDHRSMNSSMDDSGGNYPMRKRAWQEGPGGDRAGGGSAGGYSEDFPPGREDNDYPLSKNMGSPRGSHRGGMFHGSRGGSRGGSFRGSSRSRRASFRGNSRGGRGMRSGF